MYIALQLQAQAAWKWYNFIAAERGPDRRILHVNMDETAVCVCQGGRPGHIFMSRGHTLAEKTNLSLRRAYVTHIAFVCDDPEIQKLLPQILICNKHTVNAADYAAVKADLPPNVHLWRQDSAWVNKGMCKDIIRLLATSLASVMHLLHVILMFDAYGAHICPQMWNALARWGIVGLLIPASETWLLQPLDVHVFKAFKGNLQRHYQRRRVKADGPEINFARVIRSVCDAIRDVISARGWAHAFDNNGWNVGQTQITQRVCSALGLSLPIIVGNTRPNVGELSLCHPKRRTVHTRAIWRRAAVPVIPAAAPAPASASSSSSSALCGPAVAICKPIASRTRSKAASSSGA